MPGPTISPENKIAARTSPVWTKKRLALAGVWTTLLVVGAIALWHFGFLQELSNKDRLIAALRSHGSKGALICIGAQFVQVVIFAIPGEITQFAAGYVFGIWRGFLYSVLGIMLGSAFNFYFAQLVGRPTLEKFVGRATLEKVDRLLNSARGKSAIFLLFLVPGTPKDAMCYGAGFSNMRVLEFVVITGLARSPALIASIVLGSQASRRDYDAMVLTAIAVVAAILGYYFYERRRTKSQDTE